ncbi:hypothetical protein G6F57_004229 [Rhizopus arrhizus]|uniref:CBS-domain-containing protein n=1 Tax=Rhizopus oryzae TaxID=64495 RepID=A0A9P6XC79_RHIOR|nr:hypothetical protein G6F23_002623 [Rhizopus arrhizus]KAG1421464.1 hypothetical protein G6F58_003734 [Rhizopus delemar]KAG0765365.1 hypothetical protein G6F24_004487 [Rhizopus arrhizus]KAG0789757.1 hypothetical protein G6F22_006612 [Rhizopus arrhizus]KAG0792821.1 hypothetical protein G6F21_004070 [Rhizopus arrhizus]
MSIAPSSKSKSSRIPTSLNTTIHSTVEPDMLSVSSRQRQSKKDEAIRKKIEQELSKKRGNSTRIRQTRKIAGTVSALRPAQALTVRESILVIEAAQLMAAKRSDCVLVVDEEEHLSGIFTAKDLAYRVVADNLDARAITVSDIMTRNPMCVTADTSAQDALNLMVSRGFRHLPVCNEEGDIFGLLDITKCIYEALHKMEKAYGSSRKLYDALEGVEREWANSPVQLVQYMEALKDKMSCPDLTTVLDHAGPVQVTMKAQVREVAKLMKEYHTTAVLVMDHGGLAGIFTSKDIVLRVIAAGLAPDSCSVVRVMTPHPDTALPSTSILDALKKMHDGHYLNLPVLDEDKNIVGLIDVLRLTYATLEQINSIEGNQGDGSKFWHSIAGGDQTESDSVISESLSHAANSPLFQNEHAILPMPGHAPTYTGLGYSELTPADSASGIHDNDNTSTVSSHINNTFSFKFNYANKTHRFRHDIGNFANFLETIQQKIMTEHLSLSQSYVAVHHKEDENWLTVAYVDDENDQVLMTCDSDLIDSVQIAKKAGMDRVRLFVHDSMAEEQSSIVDQQQLTIEQPVTPPVIPEPVIQKKPVKRKENTEEKDRVSVEKKKRHVKPEYDLPIPQDLVLPAAITFLGVVILGVFTISRLSAK